LASRALRFRLHVLGAIAFAAYGALALMSYAQAPVLWPAATSPNAAAFFERLGKDFPVVGLARLFADNTAVIVAYAIPLGVASVAALLALWMLIRRGAPPDPGTVRLLFRWSIAFAAVSALGFPVFTQDFWLSAVWGRMIASGENPYHALFTPDALTGLPLDHFPMLMSWGPLWGVVSGAVMALAGSSVLAAAILLKSILAAAWIGALVLVVRITERAAAGQSALAVAVFGWTPLGVTQTLLEAHNDIAMASLALLWLALLLRGRIMAPLALAASVLCKYAMAPLFLVDALYALRRERRSWRDHARRMIAPALLVIAGVALFYRSPEFFDGVRLVSTWHFLRPIDGVEAIEDYLGIGLLPLRAAVLALFPAVAGYCMVVLVRRPTAETLAKAALAMMCAIVFSAASHVWPWYLVWVLAPAALVPAWWLSRFTVGAAVMAPFMVALWWVPALDNGEGVGALAMYAGAAVWMLVTRGAGASGASLTHGQIPGGASDARPGQAHPALPPANRTES